MPEAADPAQAPARPPLPAVVTAEQPDTDRDARLADLLARAASGDAEAFERFFDQTQGYARALARRIVHGADLEDTLADAYFETWRQAAQFDPARGSAVTWLLVRVRSRAIDRLRAAPSPAPDETGEGPADEGSGPSEHLWRSESQQRLHAALSALGADERWVLGLAYFRDLSHGEIAHETGWPLGTVKSLIRRAQAKLRHRLGDLPGA